MPSQSVATGQKPADYYMYIGNVDGRNIYREEADYRFFLSLLEQHVQNENAPTTIELSAYCLLPDRVEMLVHQTDGGGANGFVNSIIDHYSKYYNDKYKSPEAIFDTAQKVVESVSGADILAVSRSIHANVEGWLDYPHSSLRAYLYDDTPRWLNKTRITKLYGSAAEYLVFLQQGLISRTEPGGTTDK